MYRSTAVVPDYLLDTDGHVYVPALHDIVNTCTYTLGGYLCSLEDSLYLMQLMVVEPQTLQCINFMLLIHCMYTMSVGTLSEYVTFFNTSFWVSTT